MRKIVLSVFVFAFAVIASGTAAAQEPTAAADPKADAAYNQYLSLLRKDLRSGKKQFLAQNLVLTDTEATKFWPVYEQYTAELQKINDARVLLVKDYAANIGSLTDATAASLNQRSLDLDEAITRLRTKYIPTVGKVLPGKKAA